jgi:hypothetical protein
MAAQAPPWVRRRMTSTTRFVTVFVITVPLTISGPACSRQRPRPVSPLTFSRKARRRLPGEGAQPSVSTSNVCNGWQHALTMWNKASASVRSRRRLTTPALPHARRDHHRHGHPRDHLPAFPSDLICVDVLEIHVLCQDLVLMDSLTMRSRPFLPPRHRSFIPPQRMHDGLHGAARGQKRDHQHHLFLWCTPSHTHRPLTPTTRPSTRLAFLALSLLSMADQIACSDFPPCRAVHIGTTSLRRIVLVCCFLPTSPSPNRCFFSKLSRLSVHRIKQSYQLTHIPQFETRFFGIARIARSACFA